MPELSANYWLLIVIVLLVAILAMWRIFAATRRTRVEFDRRAREEEALAPRRNQALIDSAPAAAAEPVVPPPTPQGLAGVGEAVAAAAEPEPIVAAVTEQAGADDLTRIKGLGPKIAEQLQAMGVTRFAQIAAWSEADIDRIDAQMGRFAGRIRRDDWTGQARYLAQDDTDGYEARFGKL